MTKLRRIKKSTIKRYVYNMYEQIVENTPNENDIVNGVSHEPSAFPENHKDIKLKAKGLAVGNWKVVSRKDGKFNKSSTKRKYNNIDDLPIDGNEKQIYIVNNLPYINMLEFGGYFSNSGDWTDLKNSSKHGGTNFNPEDTTNTIHHYSRQAPHGMVRQAIVEHKNIFKNAVRGQKADIAVYNQNAFDNGRNLKD